MPSTVGLTPKQSRFVHEYLVDANGTRAAIAAGNGRAGARVAAHRLLTNANVQKALEARQHADATRLSIARENAIQGLLGAIQDAKEQRDPAAVISGWREVGRMLGFYAPDARRVQVSADRRGDDGLHRYDRMSDAELLTVIEGAAQPG